jgi:hypothetical protein
MKEQGDAQMTLRLVVALSLSLVLMNFGFDVYRRYDFEGLRREAQRFRAESYDALEQARFLMESQLDLGEKFSESSQEVAYNVGLLHGGVTELQRLLKTRGAEVTNPPAENATSPLPPVAVEAKDTGESARLSLHEVLEASYEIIEEMSDRMTQDDLYDEYLRVPGHPKDWDLMRLLADFESASGRQLSPIERTIFELKVESYRQATLMAQSRYDLELYSTVPDRIARGDYTTPDADGNYPPGETGPENGVLASGFLGGRNLFQWTRSAYPEMNRLLLIKRYIPFLMLKDVSESFGERSPR